MMEIILTALVLIIGTPICYFTGWSIVGFSDLMKNEYAGNTIVGLLALLVIFFITISSYTMIHKLLNP